MSEYKVSWEINIDAINPLEAAKLAQNLLDILSGWQFYVQNKETEETFNINLSKDDKDAVLPVTNYTPFIVQK
jgi:hypothetical protein